MIVTFDAFNNLEIPDFILCNPNKDQLYVLGNIYNRTYSPRYNALSQISFTAPNINSAYYDYLVEKRLILVGGIGYFLIESADEISDGVKKEKRVVANSLEAELSYKYVTNFSGTYKFYDAIDATGTLMQDIIERLPGWTIGTVDSALLSLYRTFDISDSSIYSFLMSDVEEAYQCVFVFDYLNQTISAYTVDSATSTSDIFLSFDNLLKEIDVSIKSDELVTALSVYGGGDLSINQVNPIGTDTIYDFSYFKSSEWMSQSLVDAIVAWEAVVDTNQATYASLLSSLLSHNETLIAQQSELTELQNELGALEGVQSARIQQGLDLTAINADIANKESEISNKEAEISSTNSTIASISSQLTDINDLVSFGSNFTEAQLEELSPFTLGNTYQNENFVQTDIMTNVQIQEEAQKLYDQAIDILAKVSQPRYEFSVDAVNFLGLEEFSIFHDQLKLGAIITIEKDDGAYIETVLLGIDWDFDDPSSFFLIFGNRLRLDDSSFILSDLFGKTVASALKTSFDSEKWNSWVSNYKTDVEGFINSALDASANNVISGSSQNVLIDANGIRVRKDSELGYEDEQIWINNGVVAFTENAWDTASLALGKITSGSTTYYGLVADVVVGRLLAGNALTIENEDSTFSVDGSGATLSNATFTLDTANGNSKILLDPTNGIKIQQNEGGTWADKFYVDSAGNVIMAGQITADSGDIGGWSITSTGLQDSAGNYIKSNGNIKLGSLKITPTTATFDGTIRANKIDGTISYTQLTNIPSTQISSGVLSGMSMTNTGSINFGGTYIGRDAYGDAVIVANNLISLNGNQIKLTASGGVLANGSSIVTTSSFPAEFDHYAASYAKQSWVSSNFYSAGESPTFGTVTASTYKSNDGYSGTSGTITIREYGGGYMYIYVHDGLISSWT